MRGGVLVSFVDACCVSVGIGHACESSAMTIICASGRHVRLGLGSNDQGFVEQRTPLQTTCLDQLHQILSC